MTRAGEKLYGDWEKRIADQARPFPWRSCFVATVMVTAIVVIGGSALFGFG